MADTSRIRVLFFDTFGTCVMQNKPVADELWKATQEALESNASSMNDESYEQWFEFGIQWNKEGDIFVRDSIAQHDNVDWRAVDKNRIELLPKLLARRGLIIPIENNSSSELQVGEGSLWNEAQLKQLGTVWHRLSPWPDTCPGLELLNKRFPTVSLSNTYKELLDQLVANSSIPFKHTFSSDIFQSYKPNPKVYLGAAEKMGVKPEECALVAAHLSDLKGAKACGFYAIYVERPLEEKAPALLNENIPDMWIKQDEDGFLSLAEHLGISAS